MLDWLAEQYVIAWSKAVFFLENPTACQWIDFFQAAGVLIGAGWVLRIVYVTFRGYRVSCHAGGLEFLASHDARKLRTAFARARDRLRAAGARGSERIGESRLRILTNGGAPLCNVGILAPRVFIAPALIRRLSHAELTAALAHELAHVLRRDNVKRVSWEAACLMAPMTFWMSDGLRLAVSSRAEFLAVFFLGLVAGLAIRMLVVPAIAYWQERRADEWAAVATGDRLTVASALIATASVSSRASRRLVAFPATCFAFYSAPVSTRVRRLVESDSPSGFLRLDGIVQWICRAGMPVLVVLAMVAVHRAESAGLAGVVCISSCDVSLRVEGPASAHGNACLRLSRHPAD